LREEVVDCRHHSCKGTFRSACPAVTDEDAVKIMNGIIPDFIIQTGHHSPDEHPLAGCDHMADTKTLNASENHYHKKSTDFGFAVKQRQTEVESDRLPEESWKTRCRISPAW
jgi:inhibitor of KinA sporulation pathway (predicted exonuclease)